MGERLEKLVVKAYALGTRARERDLVDGGNGEMELTLPPPLLFHVVEGYVLRGRAIAEKDRIIEQLTDALQERERLRHLPEMPVIH